MDRGIYQHFDSQERPFIDRCLDWVARVEDYYSVELTDFLDPRQIQIARSVLNQTSCRYFISSDYYETEYARLLIAPDYYQLELADFDLCLLEIDYPSKFAQLTHSQILGTLLNRLGIKRQLLGDILVHKGRAQVLVASTVAPLIMEQTERIARVGVKWRQVSLSELLVSEDEKISRQLLVSSYRLDTLVALLSHCSRQEAQGLLKSGKIKVNYREIDKPDYQLKIDDMISIRGYGRCRLVAYKGQTKSGKYKLLIEETLKKKERK